MAVGYETHARSLILHNTCTRTQFDLGFECLLEKKKFKKCLNLSTKGDTALKPTQGVIKHCFRARNDTRPRNGSRIQGQKDSRIRIHISIKKSKYSILTQKNLF
jgi:hypothetical protein